MLTPDDYRRQLPRFQGEAAAHNARLVARLEEIARQQGCTAAQLTIAWLLAQGPDVIPIPGTRKIQRLEENAAGAEILVSAAAAQPSTRYSRGVLRRASATMPKG